MFTPSRCVLHWMRSPLAMAEGGRVQLTHIGWNVVQGREGPLFCGILLSPPHLTTQRTTLAPPPLINPPLSRAARRGRARPTDSARRLGPPRRPRSGAASFRKSRSYWREGGHVQVKSANIVHRCLPGGLGVSTDIGQFSHLCPQLKKTVMA